MPQRRPGYLADEARRQGQRRLTRDGSLNEYPCWSPDGERIAFQSARAGEFEIFVMSRTAAASATSPGIRHATSGLPGLPTGVWIAFMSTRDGSEDVFVMRPDGSGART